MAILVAVFDVRRFLRFDLESAFGPSLSRGTVLVRSLALLAAVVVVSKGTTTGTQLECSVSLLRKNYMYAPVIRKQNDDSIRKKKENK